MEQYDFTPESTRKKTRPIPTKNETTTLSMAKVYLWMALGLLITGIVSLGLPNLLILILNINSTDVSDTVNTVYTVLYIVSALLIFPAMIIINIQGFRKNTPLILTSYIIYALAMGVLLSVLFLNLVGPGEGLNTICIAFLVTGGVFLINGLIASLTKKANLNILWPILGSLSLGAMTISLINFFIGSPTIYWIVDFVLLGVMLLVSLIDSFNIRKIAEAGGFTNNTNLAIYCAYTLYVDFIWIFVRILFYLVIYNNRR